MALLSPSWGKLRLIFFVCSLLVFPNDLFAIHAIFKGAEPIPRTHGSVTLNMPIELFLESIQSTKVRPAIGQFSDEHRFDLALSSFPGNVTQVFSDFYKGHLFRIEINYTAIASDSSEIEALITRKNTSFGLPRENILPGVRLIFWDDGATRMIMQIDETDGTLSYSLTYIDNDLFHAASRDRVQRETGGRSSYGK